MQKPFDVELFKNNLRTTWIGSEFIYIDKVDSTNNRLKKIPSEDLVHGMVLAARYQARGRGQYQRSWHATSGLNLTFTIGLCPPDGNRLTLLTLAAAFAVSEALEAYTEQSVLLKWPNDIVIGSRKVGGILTECMFFGHKPDRVLLGIGINIGEKEFPEELSESAVSLSEVSKETIVIEKLLAEILTQIELIYQNWHKHNSELHNRVSRKLIGYGEWVTLKVNDAELPGKFKFLGINEKGELLALNEQLDVNTFAHEQVRIITDQS
jgi:BirA family transcriptional regulator, biotin operon repressor / biotin---[acetyl-CoA-carboxylase] ligase